MATLSSSITNLEKTAAGAAHDGLDAFARNAEIAKTSIEGAASAATKTAGAQMERVETMIRANPLAATGIAAGIGFVVALLARRS
jgi:ElaB/YqjD/DUF883 family membrane-anchored ribosome-binding protein